MIRNSNGIKLSVLHAHLHYPTSFLKEIIDILVHKDLISIDPISKAVRVTGDLFLDESDESSIYSRLNSSNPIVISCAPKYHHRMMKILEFLYQHALDLYMLNYNVDSIQVIKEIFAALNEFVVNFDELLCSYDSEFFSLFERNPRYFNDENASLFVDFSLNVIYKIIYNIRIIIKNDENLTKSNSKYKDFYDNQQSDIDMLVQFISEFHSLSNVEPALKIPESALISAYFILYFHKKIGPVVYHESENMIDGDIKSQIIKLMDMINPEPFLYTIKSITTWNYQFELDSPLARGNKEYLQITIVIPKPDAPGISFIKQLVIDIIKKIRKIEDVYKIFYVDEKNTDDRLKFNRELAIRAKDEFLAAFRALAPFFSKNNTY